MNTQRIIDRDTVRDPAADIDPAIRVEIDHQTDEIVISRGRLVERYDTAEEACTALRASWSPEYT